MILRLVLGLIVSLIPIEASAYQCPAYDRNCTTQQFRQGLRPGNGHYQAEQRRYGGKTQQAPCSTRPHVGEGDSVANNPACR